MSHRVALVAAGAHGNGAVSSRMDGLSDGLRRRGWTVDLIHVESPPSRVDAWLDRLPSRLRRILENLGAEGDLRPASAYRARRGLGRIRADVAVVSVPPFSLLPAARSWLPTDIPLVVDYRDPWSTREAPPLLARATEAIEQRVLRRAAAVTYAGDHNLGEQLVRSGVPLDRVISVPNGFIPTDLQGVPSPQVGAHRNGTPLDLVFVGYWYGRNGPGSLPQALADVGPSVARLTVVGQVAPSITDDFASIAGRPPEQIGPLPRNNVYHRLARADAAVVTLDYASAVESRLPAKVYDYLAVGVPVVAICPAHASVLKLPEAARFHCYDHHQIEALAGFLRTAAADRAILRPGPQAAGPSRDEGADALDRALRHVAAAHASG